jgi:3-hydroxyisobutyrate dehydrogenase-like beta-hydroxyacid dehydrogenase
MIGITGYGEVGSSLGEIYTEKGVDYVVHDPYWRKPLDITHDGINEGPVQGRTDDMSEVDVLNVCIPCRTLQEFIESVVGVIEMCPKVRLVIIHSSILLGAIKDLKAIYPTVHIVHSPIRGVHPHLAEGMKTFTKYVGYADGDSASGDAAAEHLRDLGLTVTVTTSKTTFLQKLLSTTYYGMCIAFTEDMGRLADAEDVDFDMISDWTRTYNKGYTALGRPDVSRPILTRIPQPPGGGPKHIGGHCVIPNALLLKQMYPDIEAWDYVLRYNNPQ